MSGPYTPQADLKPCGTQAAYARHVRNGEPTDEACREANRVEGARYRESRRTELNTYHQQWYAQADLPTRFRRRIAKDHHLTVEQYAWMLYDQGFRCAICFADAPGGRGEWHIDHDHECCSKQTSCGECVRGLLCMNCNHGLGSFKDNPLALQSAISYLGDTK